MKKITILIVVLTLLGTFPVLPSHAETEVENNVSSVPPMEKQEVEEAETLEENINITTSDQDEENQKPESENTTPSEQTSLNEGDNISEDNSSDKSQEQSINNQTLVNLQKIENSVYDNTSFSISRISQTDEFVQLSLDFYGQPKTVNQNIYMTYKFPDEIDLSKVEVTLAGLQTYPQQDEYIYSQEEIKINYDANTISLLYKEPDWDSLVSDNFLIFNKNKEKHHFTLNVILKNEAFVTQGTQEYIFQAIGTQRENTAFTIIEGAQESTNSLTITESGELELVSIPDLRFQTVQIGEQKYVALDPAVENKIVIEDTRVFNDSWILTLQIQGPMVADSSQTQPLNIGLLDKNGNFSPLENELQITGVTEHLQSRIILDLNEFYPDQKIVIATDTSDLLAATYSATIKWTLTEATQ